MHAKQLLLLPATRRQQPILYLPVRQPGHILSALRAIRKIAGNFESNGKPEYAVRIKNAASLLENSSITAAVAYLHLSGNEQNYLPARNNVLTMLFNTRKLGENSKFAAVATLASEHPRLRFAVLCENDGTYGALLHSLAHFPNVSVFASPSDMKGSFDYVIAYNERLISKASSMAIRRVVALIPDRQVSMFQ